MDNLDPMTADQLLADGGAMPTDQPKANYFDKYDVESDASDAGLLERARLNAKHSYYRGTIAGASELSGLARVYQMDDADASAEQKAWRKEQRAKYEGIVSDLGRYDMIAPWSTAGEAGAALAGQIGGSLPSPESWLGWGAQGASWMVRAAKAAVQQSLITGAVDPIVQHLNISGGVRKEYDPLQTAMAAGTGLIIGGGLHIGGEVLSSGFLRKTRASLGAEDPSFRSASDTMSAEPAARPDVENVSTVRANETVADAPAAIPERQAVSERIGSDTAVESASTPVVKSAGEPIVARAESSTQIETPVTARSAEQSALIEKRAAIETELSAIPEGEQSAIAKRQGDAGNLPMERRRPAEGVTSDPDGLTGTAIATVPENASPQQATAIRSLQQQAMDFAQALDIPLRQGRIKNKNALGQFNTGSGVVRVREVPDFEVVAHEAGHAIEAKGGVALTDLTNRYAIELAPLVSNAAAYDPSVHVKEGFAEYIRRYIGNPAHAEAVAPGFSVAFRDHMATKHPDLLKAIDSASAAYRAYLEAPSVDAVGAVIRSRSEELKGFKATIEKVRSEGLPATVKSVVQNVYTSIFDDKAPVTRAVREMAKAALDYLPRGSKFDLKAVDNPEVLLRLFERSHQSAVRDMMDGVRGYHSLDIEGPSLTEALEIATGGVNSGGWGKWDAGKKSMFSDYLVARRAILLWNKFHRGELPNPPVPFSRADANIAASELERANPRFREAADKVHQWTRQLLKKQYEGGLIDADLYNKLSAEEFYVPFMRDLSDKPMAGGGGTRGSADGPGMTDTVKRMRGSSRDIKDPIESLMTQAFLVNRTLAHNDIIKSFVRLASEAGTEGGKFVEKIPAHEIKKYNFDLGAAVERLAKERGVDADDARVLTSALTDVFGDDPIVGSFFRQEPAGKRGEPIVFYKEGGQLRAARFMSGEEGHALYELVTALPAPLRDAWSQMVAATTTTLRAGITTNPMFALTNYIRDQFAVAILRNDYIPIISGLKGIASEVKQGEAAVLYGYGGGVSGGASIAPLERAIEADVNALAKKGYLVNRLTSFKGAMDLAGITEAGTRNSVFAKVFESKKAAGLSEYEAMIEAAFSAQDVLDFSRHGSHTIWLRKYIPFINAWAQGMDKARRTMVEPVVRKLKGENVFREDDAAFNNALLSMTKLFGVGSVLGAGWAALNAEKEAYYDVSPQVKGTHVVIPVGNRVILVPKPFELGIGFTMGEYAYQALAAHDPRAAQQFATAAWDSLTSGNVLTDIPVVKQAFELKSGKNLFTGKDIVPQNLQRLAPEMQYFSGTSSLAKWLGPKIGVSPIKVDYAIGSTFGLWGRDIMTLSSGIDPDAPAQAWEDTVFLRRLIKDPSRTSDVTTRFWDYMGQTTGKFNQAVATYDDLIKKFRDSEASDFVAKLPENERTFVIMKSAARDDGKAAFSADEKRMHPLQRAYDAVTLLNGMRRELTDNAFKTYETGEQQKYSPQVRRDLLDNIRELAQMEMRNSFVIMKVPGYADRPLLDTKTTFEKIKAIDAGVADEIATRYATAKIYTTDAVAKAYPEMKRLLLRDGSDADLKSLSFDAKSEGYQFDGEAESRPQKRRVRMR